MQKAKGKTNKLTAKKRRVIADLIIATQCIQTDGSMFLGCSISDKDQSRIVQLIIAKGEKIQKKIGIYCEPTVDDIVDKVLKSNIV